MVHGARPRGSYPAVATTATPLFQLHRFARQVRFKIKYISLTGQKVLTDASGKKVFMIRGKVLTSVHSLYFFTYSPNFAGQTPTEHDGNAPLYKFAPMRTNGWGCAPRWEYASFTKSNDDSEKVAEVAAVCNLVYSAGTMTDLKGEPLMKMTQNWRTTDVEVAAGMDPIQAIGHLHRRGDAPERCQ